MQVMEDAKVFCSPVWSVFLSIAVLNSLYYFFNVSQLPWDTLV